VVGTINVSLPDEMIDRLNGTLKELGYASRSELIRSALRSFFVEAEFISKVTGRVLAVVTMTFSIERRGVSEEVNRLQHRYENIILTLVHNHVGKVCLEVILTRGDIKSIKKLAEELKVIRGVETVKVGVALTY
jgi:CopG family nickel-responsive transcriptional regulator